MTVRRLLLLLILALSALSCAEETRESRIEAIQQMQANDQYRQSVQVLREMLRETPDDPEINHLYGLSLLSTGRPSLAVWSLRKAANHEDFAVQDGLLLTKALMRGGSAEDAVKAANQVIAYEPENMEALQLRLDANLTAMRNDDALADIDLILEIDPDNLESRIARIRALLTLDRVEDGAAAIEEVNAIVESMEDEEQRSLWLPRVCGGSASFAAERGDPDGAEEVWNDCVTDFPEEVMIANAAVEFFDSRGEYSRSLEIMRKAHELRPSHLPTVMPLVNRLAATGRTQEAEDLLNSTAEQSQNQIRVWLTIANYHEERNEPKKARDALFLALSTMEKAPVDLIGAYADLLIRAGDYEKVEAVFADLKDEPLMLNLLRGRLYLATGNPEKALANLEEGLRLWPSNTAARFLAGQAAEQQGDFNRALQEYMESHRADHSNKEAVMRLTTLLEGMGRGDEALQALNRYNQKKPTDPTPLLAILRISNRYNNEQSFNYAMERLSKIPRQQGAITTELARIRAEGGGPIMGAAMFERSGLDFTLPANSLALDQWVTYLIELKRLRKALNLARTSATAVPQFPSFQEIKGKALIASGAHEQGVKALKKALSLSPERASTLALLAQEQVRLGQAAEAIALYDRATLSDPDEPDYPWRAILLALDEGQTENAQSRLETLTKRHGEFAKANQQLALMILNEEPDRSLELATRAVRFRGGPDALTTLGQVQVQRGEYQKALKALRRSLNTRPNSPSTSYWMAMAHSGMGDSAAARKELSQALESPSFPEQEAAKKQWAQLEASP